VDYDEIIARLHAMQRRRDNLASEIVALDAQIIMLRGQALDCDLNGNKLPA
jgi:hypothetical protein